MFSNGGEATIIESRRTDVGTGRNPVLGTVNIEKEGETFYQRVRKPDGSLKSEKIIDVELSPTRNPVEAANIQNRNQAISTTANFLSAAPAVVGGFGGLGYLGARELAKRGLGRKISDIFFKRDPGKVTGKYGTERLFAGQGPISGLTGTGIIGGATLAGTLIGSALRSGIQDPVDFSGDLEDLENAGKKKPDEDSKAEEKPEKVPIGVVPQTLVSKVISSPDFNRFLSNLSSSLTATGSIAQGGAQAASDSFEEKLEEEGVGFEPLKSSDASSDVDKNNNISSALRSYQTTVDNIGKLEYAKDQIADASGLMGLLGALSTKVKTAIGLELKTPFEEIDPRTQAESLIDAIRQQNIRDLLGESGRTISNLDREIVADIFGSITADMPPSVIRNKLDKVISNFRLSLGEKRDTIVNNAEYFGNVGRGSGVIEANRELIQKILSVPDFKTMYIPKYDPSADVDMTASSGPITDIEYVEGT
tara:strand:+ start:2331 stop:3764 length:1434 start_codon:yes stop_codon:yes gene_type:complete